MLPAERRRQIVDLVTARGGCSVADLAAELGYSTATIRRDLRHIESTGQIERTHGGAVPVSRGGHETTVGAEDVHPDAMKAIADRAVEELREGQVVFFDDGTTTRAVARAVPTNTPVAAVTNGPELATTVLDRGVEVSLTGGSLDSRTRVLVGPVAESFLQRRHVDVLFLAADGVSGDAGLTTPDEDAAAVKSLAVERADRVVLVANASTLGERHFVSFADFADVDLLVTDGAPDDALADALSDEDVAVATVDP